MDSLHFLRPIQQGDVVVIQATVNRAWRSSMEVGVRVEGERDDNQRFHAATAYLTFVSLDEHGQPMVVPAVEPTTKDEERRYQKAEQRRQQRLEVRRQIRGGP
ncbi:MAG: hypothetical protein JRH20_21670 [Deltaproteobacteria bacterium]|nr:hypothetical protein [Deltaproteobacteria bacterium]